MLPRTVLVLLLAAVAVSPTPLRAEAAEESPPDRTLIDEAVERIERLYLHPGAIDPQRMLSAGIQGLESHGPELLVLEDSPTTLQLWAGDRGRIFRVDDVETLDQVSERVEEVIAFVQEGRAEDEEFDPNELRIEALRGMLRTIDRHSRLIAGSRLDEFNTRFKGTLVGIGARIGRRSGPIQVIQPFADAPAGRAGLQVGDIITHIDGYSTAAMSVDSAVDRIRGPEGVPVVLTIERSGEEGRRVFVIVREKVLVPSVESTMLPSDVGYIEIDHFSQKTSREVADHLDSLRTDQELQGVIIDLRGNTGGSMRHSARIVNYFVDEGMIVRTEGADGEVVQKLTPQIEADGRHLRYSGPVAVLVDSRTASGSEIVAGGLKYLGRSITIGSQTFGKGTVQKVYSLRKTEPEVSMKLTVARYLLPGDSFINSVGVTPDIVTGPVWLDPVEPVLPERLREPPEVTGRTRASGGLDSRKNPGGGREPTRDGVNAEPELRLMYPRLVEGWSSGAVPEETPAPEGAAELAAEEAEDRPGWSNLLGDAGEPLFNDVELRLAHEVLVQAGPGDRREELLELARPLVAEWQEQQSLRMTEAAAARDLRWALAPEPRWMDGAPTRAEQTRERLLSSPPGLEARLHLPEAFEAGESSAVHLEVRNTSGRSLTRLRARLESSTNILDGASFLIGDLAVNEKRGWTIPLEVEAWAPTRIDTWRLYLIDDDGPLGGPLQGEATTLGSPWPNLNLQVRSMASLQEDGSALVTATIQVENSGPGSAEEVKVHFGEPQLEGVERMERFRSIPGLAPGERAEVQLRLRVRNPAAIPEVEVRLRARDPRAISATTVSLLLPSGSELDTPWLRPPTIELRSPRSAPDAPPSRGGESFSVRGRVLAPGGIESVEVRVSGDKVFSKLLAEDPGEVEFEAPAVLELGPNRVRVKAVASDGVEIARSWWVLGSRED